MSQHQDAVAAQAGKCHVGTPSRLAVQSGAASRKILIMLEIDMVAMVVAFVCFHTIWQTAVRFCQRHNNQLIVNGNYRTVRIVSDSHFENRMGGRCTTFEIRVPVDNGDAALLCQIRSVIARGGNAVIEDGGQAVMGDEVNRIVEALFPGLPAAMSQLIGQKRRSPRYRIKVVAVFFNRQPAVNDVNSVVVKVGGIEWKVS